MHAESAEIMQLRKLMAEFENSEQFCDIMKHPVLVVYILIELPHFQTLNK